MGLGRSVRGAADRPLHDATHTEHSTTHTVHSTIPMTTDSTPEAENKRLVRTLMEAYNEHDLTTFVDCYAGDAYIHGAGEDFDGRDRVRSFARGQFEAFPDGTYRIEDLVAEDDRVTLRTTFTGTHERPFFGVEPTGREIEVSEIAIYRIEDGAIAEMWLEANLWGMFQQLGIVEPPEE